MNWDRKLAQAHRAQGESYGDDPSRYTDASKDTSFAVRSPPDPS